MDIKCVPLFNGSFNQTRYAYVKCGPETKMSVLIIDPMEEKIVKTTLFNSGKDFVAAIPRHFGGKQRIQVALFEIFNYQNHGYDYVERFIQSIRAACNQLRVAHYFIPSYELRASSALVAAKNVDAKYGDSLFLVEVSDEEYQIGEFKYTKDGYKREGCNSFEFVLKESPAVTLKNIMEFFEITELPQQIIAFAYSPETKFDRIKAIFNPKPVTTISIKEIQAGRIKYICCIAPFILRKSPSLFVPMFNQNYFVPTLPEPYVVTALIGDNMFTVAEFEHCEDLPAEKNIVLSRSIDRCAVIIGRCT
uniref:Uncharacterized protein n=1 Tax=Panagrolaimus sp. PS1159 TaxID=55785 RepID=A0AC35FD76_9BILA